jgi:ABC-type cobalamin/Fe3+-siderophores transport system ATPase subunit
MSTLHLRNISVLRGSQFLVHDINVTLTPGIHLIAGANGAGKTTLMKAILGLYPSALGEVLFQSKDQLEIKLGDKYYGDLISFVPDHHPCPFNFTIAQLLDLVPCRSDKSKSRNQTDQLPLPAGSVRKDEALKIVDLHGREADGLSSLSLGELKRAHLARAILQHASVMLLDEPLGPLDRHQALKILESLRQWTLVHDKIVILTCHDLTLATPYVDTVLLLDQGRLTRQGEPREVLLSTEFERAFKLKVNPSLIAATPFTLL